jgi:hypothetical protein
MTAEQIAPRALDFRRVSSACASKRFLAVLRNLTRTAGV